MSDEDFVPYAPLNALKPIARDVWIVDGPEIRFGYLGLKLPFPTRMTVGCGFLIVPFGSILPRSRRRRLSIASRRSAPCAF